MEHISDQMIDRLAAELGKMRELLVVAEYFNEDNRRAARELATDLDNIALNRPMLALFADVLRRAPAGVIGELIIAERINDLEAQAIAEHERANPAPLTTGWNGEAA